MVVNSYEMPMIHRINGVDVVALDDVIRLLKNIRFLSRPEMDKLVKDLTELKELRNGR